jgi:uncharacterized protein
LPVSVLLAFESITLSNAMNCPRVISILGVGLSAWLLLSCTPSPLALPLSGGGNQPEQTSMQQSSQNQSKGQQLPITAEAEMAGQTIQLEVAGTPQQQEMGLMYRPPLPQDRGMLFPFQPPRWVQFWMKNTPSPLDMVFLRNGVVRAIAANAPPCTADPCPTYGSRTPIDQVIELRSGRAAELGLKVGDRVAVKFLQ